MSEIDLLREEICNRAQKLCVVMGLDFVELKCRKSGNTLNIELIIDSPDGGIGIDQCADCNRRLDAELYEDMQLGDNYTLEVSSPGLDRPLKVLADFRHSKDRDVHLFLREPVNGKVEVHGRLIGVEAEVIILMTKAGKLDIDIARIEKGKQIII